MTKGPVRDLAYFAETLRGRGMTVTPDQVTDMARVFTLVDPASEHQVRAALRSLAITDPSQRAPFDEEFKNFFGQSRPLKPRSEEKADLSATKTQLPILQSQPEGEREDTTTQIGTSDIENVASRDFADLDDEQMAEARKMVMSMRWEPSDFKTRRWAHDSHGRRPDLRRTLRKSVGPEGDLLQIERRRRRLKQRPLIVIADISGSMDRYAEMFLVFAHAAQTRLRHVEVFTFSTSLTRITEDLRRRNVADALDRAANTVTDWSGGTKIGEALEEWNRAWSRRLARGGPVVMILSDGWDCGEPHVLSDEMARLARSVHSVLWLNPLAARQDYQPATRGMQAVLPYVDHLLPAASVNDLRGVVRLLESIDG